MALSHIKLPSRPLLTTRNPFAQGAWYFVAFLMLGGLAAFLTIWQVPGLLRDFQISQNPVTVSNGTIDGECSTRKGITDCDAHLTYSYNGQDYDTNVAMMFLDFNTGDYLVDVVISADKPELATLSLGLDMLWNRIAVFAVLAGICAASAVALLIQSMQFGANNARLRQAGAMTLVPVDIAGVKKARGGSLVTYIDHLKGPKTKRTSYTRLARGEEPLIVADDQGNAVGVAVLHERATRPVLLDAGLARLDLNTDERRAMLASIGEPAFTVATDAAKPKTRFHPWRGLAAGLGILVLFAIGAIGYWLWYVTSADNQFEALGMEINNMMPASLNAWGCDQLEQRFKKENAPYGCTASDYVSWK
jgi:hypothetical protein